MIRKLTPHGNSLAIVLGKPILELLNIDRETPLDISTDGTALIIRPVADPVRRAKFESSLKKVNRKFGKALRNLAK